MDFWRTVLLAIPWSGVIGKALAILLAVVILGAVLRRMRVNFKNKLRARRAKEKEAKRRRDLLEENVRTHLLPALTKLGFEAAPMDVHDRPVDREFLRSFPSWGSLIRVREPVVDRVEIQFSTYGRAAFRINATPVPKEGMMTAGGHRTAEELHGGGLHDHFETHARPWLRPGLRAIGLEPLGGWFSVWHWPYRSPTRDNYEKLVLRVVDLLPELESALREGRMGPHMRRLEFKPLPQEVLERMRKLKADDDIEK